MKSQSYYIFVPVLFISNTGKPNVVKLRISKVLVLRTPLSKDSLWRSGDTSTGVRRGWCPHQPLNLTTLRASPEDAKQNITKKPQDALVPIMFN
jgi:hypothetical protein